MSKITIEKLSDEQKKELRIPDQPENTSDWSVWQCEPSTFDWSYDSIEHAYVYEGKVKVKTSEGEVEIQKGDYVTFPQGLSCTWKVIESIKKVYQFK